MRTRIKFCGMTRAEDVRLASQLGVDAIGLIFAVQSKRRIDVSQARELRAAAGPFVGIVALFMDNAIGDVQTVISTVKPTLLQFHGAENAADCERFGLPYLKAVPMGSDIDFARNAKQHPNAAGFVLDSHAAGAAGGTGATFDWSRVPPGGERTLVLAGGLTPDNVAGAIRIARPQAVDVSSGIEAAPGLKNETLMRRFVEEVRRADTNR